MFSVSEVWEWHHIKCMWLWTHRCLTSDWLNDWEAVFDGSPPYSLLPSKWQAAECFCLSGGLYRLSNLINKASEICLLFIFPALQGFALAGKLPFSGTLFPRRCGAFLLFLMESDEHSQGTHCYPLGSLQQKKQKRRREKNVTASSDSSPYENQRQVGLHLDTFTLLLARICYIN